MSAVLFLLRSTRKPPSRMGTLVAELVKTCHSACRKFSIPTGLSFITCGALAPSGGQSIDTMWLPMVLRPCFVCGASRQPAGRSTAQHGGAIQGANRPSPADRGGCSRGGSARGIDNQSVRARSRQKAQHLPRLLVTRGNVGASHTPGNHTAETGLAGWACKIRTCKCHFGKMPFEMSDGFRLIPKLLGTRDFSRTRPAPTCWLLNTARKQRRNQVEVK